MKTLLDIGATLAAGISVCLVVVGLLTRLRLEGWIAHALAAYVLALGVIVLSAEVLSELQALNRQGFLIAHGVLAVLTLPLWGRYGCDYLRRQWREIRHGVSETATAVRRDAPLLILSTTVIGACVLGAVLIVIVPPNTWDSFMYHLSRAAMWLQNDTLQHFETPLALRNAYPINAEVLQLWLMALWGSDRLVAYVQWTAALAAMLSIYATGRQLGFSRSGSLFGALTWSTLTIVVVQTTSTKNDLLLATLCSVSFYFLVKGLRASHARLPGELVMFGLAMGLAVGTKHLAALLLPGIVLLALILVASRPSAYTQRLFYAAAWSIVGLLALGAYNYALNWVHYGALTGPRNVGMGHAIEEPTWDLFVSNLARMGFNGCDLGGLPYRVVNALQPLRIRAGEWVFRLLRIDPNPPETFELNWPFTFTANLQMIPREDASWYGPLGWLLLAPTLGWQLMIAPWKQRNIWRWATALAAVCYVLTFSAVIYWLPWEGRMLMVPVSIGAPLLGAFYDSTTRLKPLRWAAVTLAIVVLVWSATQNFHKPIWGPDAIWGMDSYEKRSIQAPEMAPIWRGLEAEIPEETRMGVLGPWPMMRWDYFFHGARLERTVVWLSEDLYPVTRELLEANDLDYLLLAAGPSDVVVSTLELHSLGTAWDLRWYWVKR